ncbi:type II secretion system inner membrane protein GspF [Verminephrobacter aporrectodeae]|uniref:type II secretion system inner membrane protein GspF n=1 Tax=Verminephrobacter aporrectodeae TaxID=1110389 RepID=UPI0002377370|nr:type II secretion system inner membrane protein GspF [Verminephrobacter aporrectodeae]MCW5222669.1 type II secretion system protein GspF [Verminephrobacter aporrectodeae subsp. tuberculatae]MCW5257099.1 type II secretion system protein GspF [Verminephrobacter aporrectodeae subsp. tuberculatae]MCW5288133.1 type II secretion system protein GspF [Verminephrobacter aporrectodeae subsp. tuberculatae]MCW8164240.1 type II secretion system protein GspF [Verminephrobacter aporrectodeae subsp. tubercu
MPAFSFEALDAQGQTRKGLMEADTARAARSLLRAQALVPLQVERVQASQSPDGRPISLGQRLFTRPVFSATALAIWTRQIAGLVSSGLPLERALTALAEEADEERQRLLVAELRAEVNAGATFARALAQHPREFSDIYCAVIGAGEHSGSLGLVLERLADDLEERQALKAKLVGAALYPAIVTLVAIVIVLFLVGYVVPQVASVFAGTRRALPFLTQAMLGISAFVRSYGWTLLMVCGLAAFGARWALSVESVRERFDAAWLKLPLIGRVARGYNAARFAGTLAMLAGAGVPILKALQAAAETLNNRALRADALDALVLVREGAPLASALAQKKRFPGLLPMFARLGEQTGQLPVMLQRAARQLSAEVQRRAMHLATLLEPLLIVTMGLVVMLIVLAVLMPIIQLNQFVK